MRKITSYRFLAILLAALVILERPAQALLYGDPGSGALLWQIILGFFIGASFQFHRFKNWVKSRFKRGTHKQSAIN